MSLLSLQLGSLLYARTVPTRYFCWAPYDQLTEYRLQVSVDGRPLSPEEIQQRYHRPAQGMDNRSSQNLVEIVELTERRYHPHDRVSVSMTLLVNGCHPLQKLYTQPGAGRGALARPTQP